MISVVRPRVSRSNRPHQQRLGRPVQGAGRLVQDQHGASFNSARAIEIRCRSPPDRLARVPPARCHTLGQAGDKPMRVGRPRRRLDLGHCCVRAAVGDVLRHRSPGTRTAPAAPPPRGCAIPPASARAGPARRASPAPTRVEETRHQRRQRALARALAPTRASVWPGGTSRDTPRSTGGPPGSYPKSRPPPAGVPDTDGGGALAPGRSRTS